MNKILLSFDVEEFNLPLEHKINIDEEEQSEFTLTGLKKVLKILNKQKIRATFFVTGNFAKTYPSVIKEISGSHEIASHGLSHNLEDYSEENAEKSKKILEKITGKQVNGFRMPRLKNVDKVSLANLGFKYDSSVSPSYIPGRYNNYFKTRKISVNGIYEVPISVLPVIRAPSWILFRILGLTYLKLLTKTSLKNPGFINVYIHPWEFNSLGGFSLPFYIRKINSGLKIQKALEAYIVWCKKNGFHFLTFSEFLRL